MFDDIPLIELVGVTSNKMVPPQTLEELKPDLLLLNPAPDTDGRRRLFDYLSRHLPRCRTVILAKQSEKERGGDIPDKLPGTAMRPWPASAFIDPDDQTHIRAEIQRFIVEKGSKAVEHKRQPPVESANYLYDYIASISDGDQRGALDGLMRHVVERRRRVDGRRQAEVDRARLVARLQSFVEQLPGIPYIAQLNNPDGNIYVSPRIEQLLGFSPREWCADPQLRIRQLHAEDRGKVLETIDSAIRTRSGYVIDYRIFRRDGALCWFHDEGRVIVDDEDRPHLLQGTVTDITDRKHAQEELERSHSELLELIGALDSLRVDEQRRLAHEMHDDFGQLLAAMKLDLGSLQQHLAGQDPEAVKYLGSINNLVDTMVSSVRRILADLPPKMVEDLGLFDALRSMVCNFGKRHQIQCSLDFFGPEPELDTRVATALYRMAQESLNNVAKHACATSVRICVECRAKDISLTVRDDGKGMRKNCVGRPGSFGLIGMRERANALGGEMKIESECERGTTIRITIPVRAGTSHHSSF